MVLKNTKTGKSIVIELDGSSHYYNNDVEDPKPLGKTLMKYRILENLGIKFYRFEFFRFADFEGVRNKIDERKVIEEFDTIIK